jgi:hypothetical protein
MKIRLVFFVISFLLVLVSCSKSNNNSKAYDSSIVTYTLNGMVDTNIIDQIIYDSIDNKRAYWLVSSNYGGTSLNINGILLNLNGTSVTSLVDGGITYASGFSYKGHGYSTLQNLHACTAVTTSYVNGSASGTFSIVAYNAFNTADSIVINDGVFKNIPVQQ